MARAEAAENHGQHLSRPTGQPERETPGTTAQLERRSRSPGRKPLIHPVENFHRELQIRKGQPIGCAVTFCARPHVTSFSKPPFLLQRGASPRVRDFLISAVWPQIF